MPIADTEVLFAMNPRDSMHAKALKALKIRGLRVPDTALLEFQIVLRSRGRKPEEIATALEALENILAANHVPEQHTLSLRLLINQAEIEKSYGLSYFDSLIAASALAYDGIVLSDDDAFDKVPGLRRISLHDL
ncbi:MAG: type II toxin-antitoxin system VapC family toxin [Candidatus Methanodesulfokora sp.]